MTQAQAREKLLQSLHDVMTKNSHHPITYTWGWRTSLTEWLDCSWFIYYVIRQAGLQVNVFTSRSAFKGLQTHLISIDQNKKIKKDSLKNIEPGDFLFWNSIDPTYTFSSWPIREVIKDGKSYRIHHIAFVQKIHYDKWTIEVIDMSSAGWLQQHEISVYDRLHAKWQKNSELYAAHVDYSDLSNILSSEYYRSV